VLDARVVFGALSGAIAWNLITWRFGIPSSSSHALIGGLVGAAMAKAGPGAILLSGFVPVAAAIVISPFVGFVLTSVLVIAVSWISVRASPFSADRRFRLLQFLSSAMLSLGHGGNDAQKTMGIITGLLYAQGRLQGQFHVPFWVMLSCQAAMALGTLAGGWRIVRTVGARITDLKPVQGFCAETGAAVSLFAATALGVPVSTTHTVIGSVVGAGAMRRRSAVRWGTAGSIVVAWFITLPASAGVAMLCFYASGLF
jgi:PiT family inorganic phosphate transporter